MAEVGFDPTTFSIATDALYYTLRYNMALRPQMSYSAVLSGSLRPTHFQHLFRGVKPWDYRSVYRWQLFA